MKTLGSALTAVKLHTCLAKGAADAHTDRHGMCVVNEAVVAVNHRR